MASNEKTSKKELCFIITPIGEDTDPIRRHIDGIIDAAIKPALSDKYEVLAAHHISKPGSITKQVIEAIYNAKLVVANLTGRNPNVMYELALRHAIGKPVIMIVERGTPVPSDIIMQRVILYSNDAKGVLELRDDLNKAESEIVFEEKGGPIVEVLGDISRDTNMLKKAAEANSGIQEPLAYILQRLDRIESSISQSHANSTSQKPLHAFKFTYGAYDNSQTTHPDWGKITDIYIDLPWVSVEEIGYYPNIDNDGGSISILIEVDQPKKMPKVVADWLKKRLASMGFIDVKFIGRFPT